MVKNAQKSSFSPAVQSSVIVSRCVRMAVNGGRGPGAQQAWFSTMLTNCRVRLIA